MAWSKLHESIRRRNGGAFRWRAAETREEHDRNLLLLIADIIDSHLPIEAGEIGEVARVVAQLVFDTAHQPLPAGVRTQQCIRRHALYTAGRYSVDLELEHERGSSCGALVGQIADREEPQNTLGQVPVLLLSGESVMGRAVSNRFGEFQLDYPMAVNLTLYVPLAERGTGIEVPLIGLT